MRLTLLSRASDLARLQAVAVERALLARWPGLDILLHTRSSQGDRDQQSLLSSLVDKGAFTADLSEALVTGDADAVVHSWKDLPIATRPETTIGGTLEREDPHDVLIVREAAVAKRPSTLRILSSSPRRSWLLEQSLSGLLPWSVDTVKVVPVRGNVPTRIAKLAAGDADALVVAKAALDRLLGFGPPFEDVARTVRQSLAACRWMVLPLREHPGAPAQGALAIEVALANAAARDRVEAISHEATRFAVERERQILAAYGGGCHQAVGATVLVRDYGTVTSVRARPDTGGADERWSLTSNQTALAPVSAALVWPRPDERHTRDRRPLDVSPPAGKVGYWAARADALPMTWPISADQLIWAAGSTTWRRLAARGIWVHGCADGLGDDELPRVDALAGRTVRWIRLTHAGAGAGKMEADTVATYVVDDALPDDLAARMHFFWTSGSQFLRALAQAPEIGLRWHASGPGRTRRVIREALGAGGHATVWLDRDDWYKSVTR